jgi:hypothetical protein
VPEVFKVVRLGVFDEVGFLVVTVVNPAAVDTCDVIGVATDKWCVNCS